MPVYLMAIGRAAAGGRPHPNRVSEEVEAAILARGRVRLAEGAQQARAEEPRKMTKQHSLHL